MDSERLSPWGAGTKSLFHVLSGVVREDLVSHNLLKTATRECWTQLSAVGLIHGERNPRRKDIATNEQALVKAEPIRQPVTGNSLQATKRPINGVTAE